ncbi:MAG: hypothetical protein MJE77_11010 [Proteobacteria bacterium]|nr:hypothetical protein [Pseudomonadota bacterium]
MTRQRIRWGPLEFDDVALQTSEPRTLARQLPARGRGGYLQDRGSAPREVRVSVRWTRRSSDDRPIERYHALRRHNDGKTRLLAHPVHGTFPAKMSIDSENQARGHIDVELLFVEDMGARPAGQPSPSPRAAIGALNERVGSLRLALEESGQTSTLPDALDGLATQWQDESPSVADISTSASRYTAAVRAEITDLEADTNSDRIMLYLALIDVSAAIQQAATAMTASEQGVLELAVDSPVTVLSLAQQLYGPAEALQRTDDILRLNVIATPNLVPGSTTLTVPSVRR